MLRWEIHNNNIRLSRKGSLEINELLSKIGSMFVIEEAIFIGLPVLNQFAIILGKLKRHLVWDEKNSCFLERNTKLPLSEDNNKPAGA